MSILWSTHARHVSNIGFDICMLQGAFCVARIALTVHSVAVLVGDIHLAKTGPSPS